MLLLNSLKCTWFIFFALLFVSVAVLPLTALAKNDPVLTSDLIHALERNDRNTSLVAASSLATKSSLDGTSEYASLFFSDDELVSLTKPSVVRVFAHVSGTATIPAFDIDFETLKIIPSTKKDQKPIEVPLDNYMTGSGFIVTSEGHIITSAHVVSDETLRSLVVSSVGQPYLIKLLSTMTKKDVLAMDKAGFGEKEGEDLRLRVIEHMRKEMQLSITKEIVIQKQGGATSTPKAITESAYHIGTQSEFYSQEQAKKFIAEGEKVQIVFVNDNFMHDGKDVAILKVDQANLPTVPLEESTSLVAGDKVFLFGNSTGARSDNLDLEDSFTKGTINAIKDSAQKTFQIIQTDIKISQDSIGGPLFNEYGDVVGIITGEFDVVRKGGDYFASAIPIDVALTYLGASNVPVSRSGTYHEHFVSGRKLLVERHCKRALEEFTKASGYNPIFGGTTLFIDRSVDRCNQIIAEGKSIDTWWEEFSVDYFGSSKRAIMFIAFGAAGVVLIFIAGTAFVLRRKGHKGDHTQSDASHGD